jgi:succinate dehydrogenase / fumarate reductase flavoprotein subunit
VDKYAKEVDKLGIDKKRIAPVILPDYIPSHVKAKQLTAEYQGTLI